MNKKRGVNAFLIGTFLFILLTEDVLSKPIINTATVESSFGTDSDTATIIRGEELHRGTITKEAGGVVTASDGTKVEIGAEVVSKDTVLIISEPDPTPSVPFLEGGYKPIGVFREFAFADPEVTINGTVKITLPYTNAQIAGMDREKLRIYWWKNEKEWVNLDGEIRDHTISISVDHLSIYAVMCSSLKCDLEKAYCYPNPFKPSEGHTIITFTFLTEHIRIRIFNVAGELVYDKELDTPSGRFEWDATNSSGEPLASGVYIYVITNDKSEPKKGKLAIIR
jgi:hypothetical protein